jgi:hypothetical protein
LIYAPGKLPAALPLKITKEKTMKERTKDLNDTIRRTREAEKEAGTLARRARADLDRLEEAEDRMVARVLGATRSHPKAAADASRPEGLVD